MTCHESLIDFGINTDLFYTILFFFFYVIASFVKFLVEELKKKKSIEIKKSVTPRFFLVELINLNIMDYGGNLIKHRVYYYTHFIIILTNNF
jgi:hypothetical protein